MLKENLVLRPSGSKTWSNCTASPSFIARLRSEGKLPEEDPGDVYTDEGSLAHEWAEKVLLGEAKVTEIEDIEMRRHVKSYVDHVLSIKSKGYSLGVEEQFQLFYNKKAPLGTADAVLISPDSKKIHIVDLKYGMGVSVQAKENTQIAIYARSAIEELKDMYEFDEQTLITLTIWQPRVIGEKALRRWVVRLNELLEFTESLDSTAQDIYAGKNLKFHPEENVCRFCPAKSFCKAYAGHLLGELPLEVENDDNTELSIPNRDTLIDPEVLTEDQLGKIIKFGPEIVKWINSVQAYVLQETLNGKLGKVGYKPVATHGNRKWANESEAEVFLRKLMNKKQVFEEKLISPTKAEKLLKARKTRSATWENFSALVVRPGGGHTLAPLEDKRPNAAITAEEFEDLEFEFTEDDMSLL